MDLLDEAYINGMMRALHRNILLNSKDVTRCQMTQDRFKNEKELKIFYLISVIVIAIFLET